METTKKTDKDTVTRNAACRKIAGTSEASEIFPLLMHNNSHPRKAALHKLINKLGVSFPTVITFLRENNIDPKNRLPDDEKVGKILRACGVAPEKITDLMSPPKEEAQG